jgi:hypothetical protein
MSDARDLAERVRERLAERKDDVLACLRLGHAATVAAGKDGPHLAMHWAANSAALIREAADDLDRQHTIKELCAWYERAIWTTVEGDAYFWQIDPAVRALVEAPADRRRRAGEIAHAAERLRKLLSGATSRRSHGFMPESGAELLDAWRGDPQQFLHDLEAIEAAAATVEAQNRRPPARDPNNSLLPRYRVEWLGHNFELLTGQPWPESKPFDRYVEIIADVIGVDCDVAAAVRRARPRFKPSPSRTPGRRRERERLPYRPELSSIG